MFHGFFEEVKWRRKVRINNETTNPFISDSDFQFFKTLCENLSLFKAHRKLNLNLRIQFLDRIA